MDTDTTAAACGAEARDFGWSRADGEPPTSCGYLTPQLLKILEGLKVRRVCDLGCGNGALLRELRKAGYYVSGVEQDSSGAELSLATNPGVNVYSLGVQDDPNPIIRAEVPLFDAVVSTEVIEHLFSPHLLPIFARRILASDGPGYLILSTPYHGYLKNLALSVFGKWDSHHTALWHGGHIKFWSRRTLTELIEANGFHVERFYGVGRIPWLWKSMILVARTRALQG